MRLPLFRLVTQEDGALYSVWEGARGTDLSKYVEAEVKGDMKATRKLLPGNMPGCQRQSRVSNNPRVIFCNSP